MDTGSRGSEGISDFLDDACKDEARKLLGERIRLLWKLSGDSQDDFVKGLGISTVTLANYMNGKRKPDSEFLLSVKTKFNVCIDWLLTGVGGMRPADAASEPQPAGSLTTQQETSSQAFTCMRCDKLEAKLERMEQQRDGLVEENRHLLREIGELKALCARFEERQKLNAPDGDFCKHLDMLSSNTFVGK